MLAVGAAAYPYLRNLQVPVNVVNPLESYPNRDWEKVYRDQYRYDGTFTFVCAPNDTHNCRLRAFMRNGVAHAHRAELRRPALHGPARQQAATAALEPARLPEGLHAARGASTARTG